VPEASSPECRACGLSTHHWAVKDGFSLRRCRHCGSVLCSTAAAEQEGLAADYADYHRAARFEVDPPTSAASLARLVESAEEYRQTGRWLDLGFGEGALLQAADAGRWACHGVEVSPQALAFGRSRGWAALEPNEAENRFPVGGFDVVTLIEVIEHLVDPRVALKQAVRWLRLGGLLYLTTPNGNSLNRIAACSAPAGASSVPLSTFICSRPGESGSCSRTRACPCSACARRDAIRSS
jgi:2-polyprenyl-3-methyl-5-hydroxy-6-metoxy-1,4-benzoquinol methylase